MSDRERLIIAGLGGLTPVLAGLLVIDLERLLFNVTPLAVLSYGVRATALFGVGALVGWLHKTERNRLKLFQLGIAAPALITGMLTGVGAHLNQPQREQLRVEPSAAPAGGKDEDLVESFDDERPRQQIWRGLVGVLPGPIWYVVAGNYYDLKEAKQRTSEMSALGFKTYVYQTYGTGRYYEVVIGADSSESGAIQIQRKAQSAGVKPVWRFCYDIIAHDTCSEDLD